MAVASSGRCTAASVGRRLAHSTPGRRVEPATSEPSAVDIRSKQGKQRVQTLSEKEYAAARERGELNDDSDAPSSVREEQEACAGGSKVGGAQGEACERKTFDWTVQVLQEYDKSENGRKIPNPPPATRTKQTVPEGQSDG